MRASGKWLCIVVCALCITGVVISPLAAPAQSFGPPYIWDAGGADDKWDTIANWNFASYPDSGDSVVFPDNSGTAWTCEPVVGTNDPAEAGALALYESVTLTGTDHSLTANSLYIDASSATGDYLELVVDGSGTEFIAVLLVAVNSSKGASCHAVSEIEPSSSAPCWHRCRSRRRRRFRRATRSSSSPTRPPWR